MCRMKIFCLNQNGVLNYKVNTIGKIKHYQDFIFIQLVLRMTRNTPLI